MKLILTIGMTLLSTITFADTIKPDKNVITVSTAKPHEPITKSNLSEAEAYKLLYDNQVKSNDSILQTIFYALGGLGGAVLLVFASNWWFNEKKVKDISKGITSQINEGKNEALNEVRDKINTLSSEKTNELNQIQTKLQEEVTLNIKSLTLKFSEFTEKIRAEIKEDNKDLSENYQELLKSYNENLIQQITTLKNSFEEKTIRLARQIEETEKRHKDFIIEESKGTKRDTMEHKARIDFLNAHYNVSLKSYLDLALYEFEIKSNWRFKYTSQEIIKCLEKVSGVYEDELKSFVLLSDISMETFPMETERIKSIIKDKPTLKL